MAHYDRLRLRIAQEAARIMQEQGIHDHDLARRKAARRLGVEAGRSAPRNDEIDAALLEYQRIYGSQAQTEACRRLRKLAIEAMKFVADYSPLLCGRVWEGTAGEFNPIVLHLFADEPDEIHRKLVNAGIPFNEDESELTDEGRRHMVPSFIFYADGARLELLVFPPKWRGRTCRRRGQRSGGSLPEVAALLCDD